MAETITVIGRLGGDPALKSTSKGEVVEFSVARTTRVLGPDGRWSDGETAWYAVSAWDRLGRNAIASLRRGQPVIVHGQVHEHEWTGRDGETRRELRLRATAVGHDLNGGTTSFAKPERAAAPARTDPQPQPVTDPIDGPAAPPVAAPAPAGTDPGWSTLAAAEVDVPF